MIGRSLFAFLFAAAPLFGADWHIRKAEGWAWYEKQQGKPKEEVVEVPQASSSVLSASSELANVRKELEERLAAAILSPTSENVIAYMEMQEHWIERSAEFAQTWAHALLQRPDLDATVTGRPTSQYGLEVYSREQQRRKQELIRGLSNEFGLFFFYEGKDQMSHAVAMVMQQFEKRHGWSVLAVSVDGVELAGFQNRRVDDSVAKSLNLEYFPAILLVHPTQEQVVPVAFGPVSVEQIEDNIVMQFKEGSK
jgi:conjugal transfer pilus assembly protein TraF